jgi:uncharacterized protein YqeY
VLKDTLTKDLKAAMLAGDKRMSAFLRDLKSAILAKEVAEGKRESGLSDSESIAVLKKEQKSRKESMDVYTKAGATERAEEEKYQLDIIQGYLPEELSEEKTRELVDQIISDMEGDPTMKDMGRIIGQAKQQSDNVDAGLLAKIVKEKIS